MLSSLFVVCAAHSHNRKELPILTATPPRLSNGGGEQFVISWQDEFSPVAGDRILVSCGKLASVDDCLEKGGSIPINITQHGVRSDDLINMRCNYSFRYVRDLPAAAAEEEIEVLAEVSVPLAPGLATSPTQGHIAFADNVDEMWVLWVSGSRKVPVVHFSTLPLAGSGYTATGSSGTYHAADMCSAPANQSGQQLFIDPGYMHRVLLRGLLPDTDYYYRFGLVLPKHTYYMLYICTVIVHIVRMCLSIFILQQNRRLLII